MTTMPQSPAPASGWSSFAKYADTAAQWAQNPELTGLARSAGVNPNWVSGVQQGASAWRQLRGGQPAQPVPAGVAAVAPPSADQQAPEQPFADTGAQTPLERNGENEADANPEEMPASTDIEPFSPPLQTAQFAPITRRSTYPTTFAPPPQERASFATPAQQASFAPTQGSSGLVQFVEKTIDSFLRNPAMQAEARRQLTPADQQKFDAVLGQYRQWAVEQQKNPNQKPTQMLSSAAPLIVNAYAPFAEKAVMATPAGRAYRIGRAVAIAISVIAAILTLVFLGLGIANTVNKKSGLGFYITAAVFAVISVIAALVTYGADRKYQKTKQALQNAAITSIQGAIERDPSKVSQGVQLARSARY